MIVALQYFWALYTFFQANDSKVLFSMSAIARVKLHTHIIPNKWDAIARVLLQLLCMDAERSFGRCFFSAKESEENSAVIFVASSSVVFVPCQALCNTQGLCLYIPMRLSLKTRNTSWSCKLFGSKNISKSDVCFCRLMKCFGMQILQSWLYGWKTWRRKTPTQTLTVRALHEALACNICLQMLLPVVTYLQVGEIVEAHQWLWDPCAGVVV